MSRAAVVLIVVVMVSAIGVVYSRHLNRVWFVELQSLQAQRDRLNVEWGQLLLEQGTWSVHGRIEDVARQKLKMGMPTPADIVVVQVDKGARQ
jgi:cell division protein FtsL